MTLHLYTVLQIFLKIPENTPDNLNVGYLHKLNSTDYRMKQISQTQTQVENQSSYLEKVYNKL